MHSIFSNHFNDCWVINILAALLMILFLFSLGFIFILVRILLCISEYFLNFWIFYIPAICKKCAFRNFFTLWEGQHMLSLRPVQLMTGSWLPGCSQVRYKVHGKVILYREYGQLNWLGPPAIDGCGIVRFLTGDLPKTPLTILFCSFCLLLFHIFL